MENVNKRLADPMTKLSPLAAKQTIAPTPQVVVMKPTAQPVRLKARHKRVLVSFHLCVLAPLLVVGLYLWGFAEDQYASVAGFTVRQDQNVSSSQMAQGLSGLIGLTHTSRDADILYEFIRSPEIVRTVDAGLNLRAHYEGPWPKDSVFALWPDGSREDLHRYWNRKVRISYDQASGLIELRVRAFSPGYAQALAQEIVAESQRMINALNIQIKENAMRYAERDLQAAAEQLRTARQALTEFRTRTQIVDPAADIRGRMGVLNTLQHNLADALVSYDLLLETSSQTDARVRQAQRRIDVMRQRIAQERQTFTAGTHAGSGKDYPSLIAEYERLSVDREFAEEAYAASRVAFDLARAEAVRQSLYLAAYIQPTLAETPEYPQRVMILLFLFLLLFLSWSILVLAVYGTRDRL